jgi:hypothetical protein
MNEKLERLQASTEKAEAKVEKCKKTIERHKKQLAKKEAVLIKAGFTKEQVENDIDSIKWPEPNKPGGEFYWEACDVEHKRRDIRDAGKKLEKAEKTLSNWKEKLAAEQKEEDNVKKADVPEVIMEFLNRWEDEAVAWNVEKANEVDEYIKKLKERGYTAERAVEIAANNHGQLAVFASRFEGVKRENFIKDEIAHEKKRKGLKIVWDIKGYAGEIKSYERLYVDVSGNLNGIVVGERNTVEVNTIGAGGYNIQRYHYRTLVKVVK